MRPAVVLLLVGSLASAWAFDGRRAFELIERQCAFGPRVPGTPAHTQTRHWLIEQMKGLGYTVVEQPFQASLPLSGDRVEAGNLWATPEAQGPARPAVLLSAHWDTRPWADEDPSGADPPMAGANDGASGVAAVLELARAIRELPVRSHVALALWDAEDAGRRGHEASWALGARHAAANPPVWIDRVTLGINLDLVAGAEQQLRPGAHSRRAAPEATHSIWRIGRDLAPRMFLDEPGRPITDDHLPWIQAGLPYVNLIGWPYPYWHTAADTPENCSPQALQAVGEVVYQYLIRGRWRSEGRLLDPTGH